MLYEKLRDEIGKPEGDDQDVQQNGRAGEVTSPLTVGQVHQHRQRKNHTHATSSATVSKHMIHLSSNVVGM